MFINLHHPKGHAQDITQSLGSQAIDVNEPFNIKKLRRCRWIEEYGLICLIKNDTGKKKIEPWYYTGSVISMAGGGLILCDLHKMRYWSGHKEMCCLLGFYYSVLNQTKHETLFQRWFERNLRKTDAFLNEINMRSTQKAFITTITFTPKLVADLSRGKRRIS